MGEGHGMRKIRRILRTRDLTVDELLAKADEIAREGGVEPLRQTVLMNETWRAATPAHFASLALACYGSPPPPHTIALFLDRLEERVVEQSKLISA